MTGRDCLANKNVTLKLLLLLTSGGWLLTQSLQSPVRAALTPEVLTSSQQKVVFNRDIRPILSDKCIVCHGPDASNRNIKLRLDSEATAIADLGRGRRAIVAGNPEQSELVKRITSENEAMRMPPVYSNHRLTQAEINLLVEWIRQGAQWQQHWAFMTPVRPQLPAVKNSTWPKNAVDRFVLERLEREGLQPSAEADRATLIRRLSLDLTGLPPTPEEIDDFLDDKSPNAYEKVVDRLLASPRYGERMAFRWLDAARYADTNGYQIDGDRSMWRWRDWVIEAFNRNLPFDQFVVEQLAGDLLPNATLDQKIATAFNRNHRINAEGGIVPEEYARRVCRRSRRYHVDRLYGIDDGVRALSRPQVRPADAAGVLPALRLLQQHSRRRPRIRSRQFAAVDVGADAREQQRQLDARSKREIARLERRFNARHAAAWRFEQRDGKDRCFIDRQWFPRAIICHSSPFDEARRPVVNNQTSLYSTMRQGVTAEQ